MGIIRRFFQQFKKVTVYALVGESGTGKSSRAKMLAQKYGITHIIDDGLLIQGDRIIAGRSAKEEKSFLAAVKTAVFDDKQRRDKVAIMLQRHAPKKILILGTSEKMVNKIAMRLQIPPPQKIISIEDISSPEEIEIAKQFRNVEGKHVIPVPSVEIKRSYPKIFHDRIQLLIKGAKPSLVGNDRDFLFEKSVVRPSFSKTDAVKISENRLRQMLIKCINEYDHNVHIKKISIRFGTDGYNLILIIDVPFGIELADKIESLQKHAIHSLERQTGILVKELNIIIDKIKNNV